MVPIQVGVLSTIAAATAAYSVIRGPMVQQTAQEGALWSSVMIRFGPHISVKKWASISTYSEYT